MNIVPFLKAHLRDLIVHEYMGYIQEHFSDEYGEMLENGDSYSVIDSDGKVVACAGVIQITDKRYNAWALFSEDSGKNMFGITKMSKYILNKYKDRVETHVRTDFELGKKWMDMLEFTNETPDGMKKYGDDGYDYYLYARVS